MLLAVLLPALGLCGPFPWQTARAAELPYRVEPAMTSSYGSSPRYLSASGSLIVWQDSRGGAPDIYAYDLDDQREFRVARSAAYRTQPAVDGSRIVWVNGSDPEQRKIEGLDLSQGTTLTVTRQPGEVADPAISGHIIVWRQRVDGRWTIEAQDLTDGETWTVSGEADNNAYPAIAGDTVVWQAYRDGHWRIMRYDLTTRTTSTISGGSDDETRPATDGTWLVFLRQPATGGPPRLVLRDLKTGAEKILVQDHLVAQPAVRHGVVAWEDWRTGLPDVYAYDIAQDITFAIARSQQAYQPAVSERGVAWLSQSDMQRGRVQAVAFIPRLPTDPLDPPAVPSADHQYVAETHHFMSSGFKAFWQAHGGPQLLGYPLTEEFSEKDPATGETIIVQYFQRAELEYRASGPEGHKIGLARLGVELTSGRDFPGVQPFGNSADRLYFPETGHSLALGFKEFWDANGGLAMFGYPISEELQENGRTVQYFERARFEFDPSAKDPRYQVVLGLLGQEALQRKGWIPNPPVDTTMLVP
ncbi:MAG TPA: hypothetical protein VFU72_04545 [Nitrolancea sp.]|nr:hypothetical protein [Nitrolancea sp.]